MPDDLTHDDCLDHGNTSLGPCAGTVTYFAVPGGNAFPRCDHHAQVRLDRWENSIEREALSDIAPAWFDPSYAGERWDDDY